ncbi:MAG: hypothetical protein R6U27_07630 [Desulfobacterales bacterium]
MSTTFLRQDLEFLMISEADFFRRAEISPATLTHFKKEIFRRINIGNNIFPTMGYYLAENNKKIKG